MLDFSGRCCQGAFKTATLRLELDCGGRETSQGLKLETDIVIGEETDNDSRDCLDD